MSDLPSFHLRRLTRADDDLMLAMSHMFGIGRREEVLYFDIPAGARDT